MQICQSVMFAVATQLRCILVDEYSFPKTRNNYKSSSTSGSAGVVDDFIVNTNMLIPIREQIRSSISVRDTVSSRASNAIPSVSAIPPAVKPTKRVGWLRKQGHFVSNWKRRYFVLLDGKLNYFEEAAELPPYGAGLKGEFVLANSTLRMEKASANGGVAHRLILTHAPSKKQLVMECPDETEQNSWAAAMSEHIGYATARP